MKKCLYLAFALLLILTLPINANAESATITLSCPSTATSGSTISCTISASASTIINGVAANYNLGSSFEYVSFTPSGGFSAYYLSASGFSIGNLTNTSKSVTLGTLKVKVNSAGTLSITNFDFSDTNGDSLTASTVSASVRILSTDTNLQSLSLSSGTLSPSFSASTTSYTATVNASSVKISATAPSNGSVSGTGTKSLSYGTNTFKIVSKSESGSTKTYTITITRPDNRSSNNYLSSLKLSSGSISFSKTTTSYTVTVDNSVSSINISATAEDSKSTVSGTGTKSLSVGTNNFSIKVIAENGSTKTYTVKVIRKNSEGETSDLSDDNDLKSLSIEGYDISFDADTTTYTIDVDNTVTSVKVNAKANDSNATVNINNVDELEVGINKITIDVTSESGEVKTYTIIVNKSDDSPTTTIDELVDTIKSSSSDKIIVNIQNSDSDVLTKEMLDLAYENNKTLVINKYDEDGNIIYIYEMSVDSDSYNDMDTGITCLKENLSSINGVFNDNGYYCVFDYLDDFPNNTTVSFYVGDKYVDLENIYAYYVNDSGEVVLLKSGLKVENGYVTLTLDKGYKLYLIGEEIIYNDEEESSLLDNKLLVIIPIVVIILILLLIIILKQKKKKGNMDN